MRPDMVLSRQGLKGGILSWVLGSQQIWIDELAAAAIDTGLNGCEKKLLLNADLVTKGREALGQTG